MDKRKPRRSDTSIIDELAIAKSAAWAWYERGSGSASDGGSIREADVWRTKGKPKPSRYKLEALRNVQQGQSSNSTKNSLLDKYEIDRISRQLEHYIKSSHAKHRGGDSGGVAAAEIKNKASGKKKMQKGFWFLQFPACGSSRNDVVESRGFEYRQRRPEKGRVVAVVEVVGCRPRPWGIRV